MAGAVAKKNLFSVLTEEEEVMKKLDRQERRRQRKQEREQARAAAEAERAQQLAATPASARVGSGRWADFSEDDEDYDFMQPGVAVNGDRKPRSGKDTEDAFYTTESESETDSEEEEEQEAEASSSSDSEDETNVQRRPEPATPTRNKPGHEGDAAPHAAKLLSRKERKQRELAELDALFNEMHIAPSPGSEKEPQAASRGGNDGVARRQANGVGRAEEETQGGGASEAAKKKKKKKKPTGSAGATSPQAGEGATQANNSDDEKEDSPKSEDCPRRPGTVKPPGVPAGMRRKAGAGAGRGSTADEARRLAALEEEKKKAAAKKEKKAKLYFPKNQVTVLFAVCRRKDRYAPPLFLRVSSGKPVRARRHDDPLDSRRVNSGSHFMLGVKNWLKPQRHWHGHALSSNVELTPNFTDKRSAPSFLTSQEFLWLRSSSPIRRGKLK